jgi:hypothetical protein
MGRTPLELKLPEDDYIVQVGQGKRFSLKRDIALKAPSEVAIDLRFEGAIAVRQPPCFESTDGEEKRLRDGNSLGSLLGVQQVVLLRHERREIGPGWLAATLVDVVNGRKIREGGLERRSDDVDEDALDELSRFIATGERTAKVRDVSKPEVVPAAAAPAIINAPPPAAARAEVVTPGAWRKPTGYTLLGGGALFAVGGFAAQLAAASAQSDFDRLSEGGITVDERIAAANARDRAASLRTWMFAGYGLGAAALVGGVLLTTTGLFAPEPASASTLTVAPSLDARAPGAVLSGAF